MLTELNGPFVPNSIIDEIENKDFKKSVLIIRIDKAGR
jgi:hypothetical protein